MLPVTIIIKNNNNNLHIIQLYVNRILIYKNNEFQHFILDFLLKLKNKNKYLMSVIIRFLKNFIQNMIQLLSFGKKTIKNSLSIYIKTNTGNTITVDLNRKWDIKNVKELVAPQLGLQPDEVKIIFAGKELSDNTIVEVKVLH